MPRVLPRPVPCVLSLLLCFACCLQAATTTAAETPVAMTPAQQRQLNTFFSNFSEAAVPSFAEGTLPPQARLDFALQHAYINKFKSLKKSSDGQSVLVPADMVDTILIKYLGAPLPSHAQKAYPVPLADGEAYVFSQIRTLTDLGQDIFRAEGFIYYTGPGGDIDPHGTPEQWRKAGEDVTPGASFTARIQARDERYVLLDYSVAEQ
ncbi:hypothetical protein [Megalodesulfovibrio paquesii]